MTEILTIEKNENKLRQISKEIHNDKQTKIIMEQLRSLLINDDNTIGIAAPQIGILKRVTAIKDVQYDENQNKIIVKKILYLINPVIIKCYGENYSYEGCLSVPGKIGKVKRSKRIVVQDKFGTYKFDDILATIVQHEIDHLNGILFIDKTEELIDNKGE